MAGRGRKPCPVPRRHRLIFRQAFAASSVHRWTHRVKLAPSRSRVLRAFAIKTRIPLYKRRGLLSAAKDRSHATTFKGGYDESFVIRGTGHGLAGGRISHCAGTCRSSESTRRRAASGAAADDASAVNSAHAGAAAGESVRNVDDGREQGHLYRLRQAGNGSGYVGTGERRGRAKGWRVVTGHGWNVGHEDDVESGSGRNRQPEGARQSQGRARRNVVGSKS